MNIKPTLSREELRAQFRNLANFRAQHGAKLAELHRKIAALSGESSVLESIAAGDDTATSAHVEIAALQMEQARVQNALGPVKTRLNQLVVPIAAEGQALSDELTTLHRENSEKLFDYIAKRINAALPGWLQPSELRWVALRSQPFRAQAAHEAAYPAAFSIGYVRGPHPVTGEMTDLPDEYFTGNPQGYVVPQLDRLEAGIIEAKKRREQLNRELAA